ncbi:acyl--CoA ligase [Leucobacter allii]|uniref:Acyl--CoA ligase n=1 Tax=Leucobacter allii TaxID=2932247 RepID=A0ABY4FL17_9MICO|nr:class I adenylate-forming enzyme family protein [Leucobacter allii]UOQ56966.1 acyl--CoA ligase [Leucobacter allii]
MTGPTPEPFALRLARSRNQAATIDARHPERDAIVFREPGAADDGGTRATRIGYAELLERLERRSAAFAGRFAVGERVGILALNSPDWLIAFLSLQLAGAVPVPIGTKLPAPGVAHVLATAEVRTVLAADGLEERARTAGAAVLPLGADPAGGDADPATPPRTVPFEPGPDDLAMVLATSGSTGAPKGVPLTHASHRWVQEHTRTGRAEPWPVLVSAPLYHMNALARSQKALANGETIVLLRQFDAAETLRSIAEEAVAEVSGVPPMFALITEQAELLGALPRDSVTHVNMASAPAGAALDARMRQLFPNARVTLGYGTTESGPVAFMHPADREVPVGSVGIADPGVELRLVEPGTGAPAAGRGVLEIRTPAMFPAYLGRSAADSAITPDGFYHTRDIFEVRDGAYFFAGREDDMFSSGGENVYPSAVESALTAHPAVKEAVVVPVPDEVKAWKPVAFVTLQDELAGSEAEAAADRAAEAAGGDAALEAALRAHALTLVEPFAHPRRVWRLAEMPLAGTNKIDRAELTRRAARLMAEEAER